MQRLGEQYGFDARIFDVIAALKEEGQGLAVPGRYPSVTRVLGVYADLAAIPDHVLQHAADRGTKSPRSL